jgi:hypothetical protein
MEKENIINHLNSLLHHHAYNDEQKLAIKEAVTIIKNAKKWDQCIKAVEVLVKLLGIGSKFFDP